MCTNMVRIFSIQITKKSGTILHSSQSLTASRTVRWQITMENFTTLPFNMYTFNKMWGVVTPEEAAAKD